MLNDLPDDERDRTEEFTGEGVVKPNNRPRAGSTSGQSPNDETIDTASLEPLRDTASISKDAGKTVDLNDSSSPSDAFSVTQDFVAGQGQTTDFRPGARPVQSAMPQKVGDYEIKKILGRGGMGIVYKAHHRKLDRTVALKMVLAGAHASTQQLERFIAEARAVAHLQHPNIVQIFEVGEENNLPYFSLEYVDGQGLDRFLSGKPIAAQEAAQLTITLCRAMQYAHDHGVLHRDLKPANVLLTADGVPKISDFGLAKRLEDSDDAASTRTGTIMGTPSYMSPEQALGSTHSIGAASDQYSLGAMLYEFMTGRPPFLAAKPMDVILKVRSEEPVAPRQLLSTLPADLETICLKALQKDPQKRYASCAHLAADLERYLRGEPILARPVGNVERAWRWCKRNPVVASLATAAAASLLLVAIVSTWSAWTVASKNELLANANTALNNANTDLKQKNEELDASSQENIRRSERLQTYVQEVFREVNNLNVTENPRIREFKDKTLNKTLPLIEEITNEIPEGGQGVATKINALLELAKSYRDQSLGTEAERVTLEAIRLARDRVIVQEGSDASRFNLSLALRELATIQVDFRRDAPASLQSLEEALSISHDIVDNSKKAPNGLGQFPKYRSQFLLGDMLHLMGVSAYRLGDSKTAIDYYLQSMAIRKSAMESIKDGSAFASLEKPPSEAEQKKLLSDASRGLPVSQLAYAAALNRCGRAKEAEPILRGSYDQTEKLLAEDASNPLRMRVVVGAAGTLGEFLAWNNRIDEGLPLLLRAAELSAKMLEKNPESMELRRAAGTAYHRYAQWLAHTGKSEHTNWGEKGLNIRRLSAEAEAKSERRQLEWMLSLSRYGDTKKSIEIADGFWDKAQKDPEVLTELAQAYSQCSARAADSEKTALQQKALKAIQTALGLGFKDTVLLASEIDYLPLHDLPEFNQMVATK